MSSVRGMVQVDGVTYRIARVGAGRYEVTRILDDASLGLFFLGPPFELRPTATDSAALRLVAQTALRDAKTSWQGERVRL